MQLHFASGLLCHLIVLLLILSIEGLIRIFLIVRLVFGAAAHATLDTEQLICYTRSALADIIASLQGSDGGVIAASEVQELLTMIHDILNSVVSKQFGNMA